MLNENFIPLYLILEKLNYISWNILKLLNENEYLSYSNIKKDLKLSQEKCSKEIARLEGALLIESKVDELDERAKRISITRYGKSILKLRSDITK